jgi:hypothetical protein
VRRRWVGLLAACALTLASSGSASATPLSFTFDSDNQNWTQSQDQADQSKFEAAGFQATGGHPGGHLRARDTGPENGCPGNDPCELLTFYSPLVTPLGANYNGLASFDLRSSDPTPNSAAELLLLAAGDNYLDGLLPSPEGASYNRFSIPLNESANWAVCPYAGGSCTPPSQAQFKSLIGATDQIAVMADIAGQDADGTGETYDLDNVTLTEGAPIPVTPAPHTKKKCKKRRAAAAKKCKKKRHAQGQRLTRGASTAPSRQRS